MASVTHCAYGFQNHRYPRGKWIMHELTANWPRAYQTIAAVLDVDGQPDLVASTTGSEAEVRSW